MTDNSWNTATSVLRMASELVDRIQQGIGVQGFDDVRPMHGFAFARLSESPATAAQLAAHLGITKQATSEVVTYLIGHGYLTREPDATDRRASLLLLTERGHACTLAAQHAAAQAVAVWEGRVSPQQRTGLHEVLAAVAVPGRLRPTW